MSETPPHPFSWAYLLDHLASIFTALASLIAILKINRLHLIVNSRLTQLIAAVRGEADASARAEGHAAGRQEERAEQERREERKHDKDEE